VFTREHGKELSVGKQGNVTVALGTVEKTPVFPVSPKTTNTKVVKENEKKKKNTRLRMKFNTNKEKGIAGLSFAIAYFSTNGYTVSIPLNDGQKYDLVVDDGEGLLKVQVKATGTISKYGSYVVSLRSCGGTNGSVYGRVIDDDIDILFVVCGNKDFYLIPKRNIKNVNSIYLGKDYQRFKVDM